MDHVAVGGIPEMNVDGIADANPDERSGDLAVEGPVAERRGFGEAAFLFDGEQIEPDGDRVALADRGRKIGRVAGNVGFDQRLRRSRGRDQELTLHARQLVTGNAAEIDEVSS